MQNHGAAGTMARNALTSGGINMSEKPLPGIVKAEGEEPLFKAGDQVRILTRSPIGHYRVPTYIRGKRGRVEVVIEPPAINNEDEGFGRNAGVKRHYYRLAIPLTELWRNYAGSPSDGLRIEVFETWLERS
jgi:nitrile hydratase subunit beta